ncbi:MAG: Tryptophan synthase alpha chain [Myxococcaceae bacterium]|nr:Tryptophan synthase alpha chain [Myxococcaceae bacterium]
MSAEPDQRKRIAPLVVVLLMACGSRRVASESIGQPTAPASRDGGQEVAAPAPVVSPVQARDASAQSAAPNACHPAATLCGGECRFLYTDPASCGACDAKCKEGFECVESRCVCAPPNKAMCAGRCVEVTADFRNCGACGKRCGAGQTCDWGKCKPIEGKPCWVDGECATSSSGRTQVCSNDAPQGVAMPGGPPPRPRCTSANDCATNARDARCIGGFCVNQGACEPLGRS